MVNIGTTIVVVVFYIKFGFYGWPHLLSIIFIHYSVLPIDDWMEKQRPFPYYTLPMLAFASYYFPLVTILALIGDVIVNLRALIGKDSFIYERLEGIGDVLIYVIPFTLPAGLSNFELYLAATLFILFADSMHKIGHKETKNSKLMWISGLTAFLLVSYIFATPTTAFAVLFLLAALSVLPFKFIKNKVHAWAYSQAWFGFAGFIAFYYYLFYVVA